jgi:ATP-dependent helicase YprA (DUF1998 family)
MLHRNLLVFLSRPCSVFTRTVYCTRRVLSTAFVKEEPEELTTDDPGFQLAREFREAHGIQLRNIDAKDDSFLPIIDFDSVPFSPELKRALLKQGFKSPTPTQAQSWPIALLQRDIISIAKTGSGKTCGFLLPAFQRLLASKKSLSSRWGSAANERMKLRAWGDVHPRKNRQ